MVSKPHTPAIPLLKRFSGRVPSSRAHRTSSGRRRSAYIALGGCDIVPFTTTQPRITENMTAAAMPTSTLVTNVMSQSALSRISRLIIWFKSILLEPGQYRPTVSMSNDDRSCGRANKTRSCCTTTLYRQSINPLSGGRVVRLPGKSWAGDIDAVLRRWPTRPRTRVSAVCAALVCKRRCKKPPSCCHALIPLRDPRERRPSCSDHGGKGRARGRC